MIDFKALVISILIPNAFGFVSNLLGNSSSFDNVAKPSFTPPDFIFPIVWITLFILMGISSYIIYKSDSPNKKSALIVYGIQLVLNSLWTLFFFNLKWYLFSFIWILLIIAFVIIMIYKFYKINKAAGLLQIPYLLWLIFASVLSFSVYLMN